MKVLLCFFYVNSRIGYNGHSLREAEYVASTKIGHPNTSSNMRVPVNPDPFKEPFQPGEIMYITWYWLLIILNVLRKGFVYACCGCINNFHVLWELVSLYHIITHYSLPVTRIKPFLEHIADSRYSYTSSPRPEPVKTPGQQIQPTQQPQSPFMRPTLPGSPRQHMPISMIGGGQVSLEQRYMVHQMEPQVRWRTPTGSKNQTSSPENQSVDQVKPALQEVSGKSEVRPATVYVKLLPR